MTTTLTRAELGVDRARQELRLVEEGYDKPLP